MLICADYFGFQRDNPSSKHQVFCSSFFPNRWHTQLIRPPALRSLPAARPAIRTSARGLPSIVCCQRPFLARIDQRVALDTESTELIKQLSAQASTIANQLIRTTNRRKFAFGVVQRKSSLVLKEPLSRCLDIWTTASTTAQHRTRFDKRAFKRGKHAVCFIAWLSKWRR